MRDKTKYFLRCICIVFMLMLTAAYAEDAAPISNSDVLSQYKDTGITTYYLGEELAGTNPTAQTQSVYEEAAANLSDLIEYNVVYTVTTIEGITSLNAVFTVYNGEAGNKTPLLVAAVYDDGKLAELKTAEPTISPGATINETVSIIIPDDKTENYYIKLFAWESAGSLRPLGKHKTVTDIDSYLREKLTYVTAAENEEFKIYMNTSTVEGGSNETLHTIEYDAAKVSPTDLCGFTYESEMSPASISNTGVVIESVDTANGIIKYKFLNNSGRNTGINNVIEFKALTSITDAEIKYTIQ